ncbi:MAG: nucleotide exchange factor GrpE [Chloroflexi bacterium]|nr:nucleotide exchange factor GrpE [Chloroflexota bacterium]
MQEERTGDQEQEVNVTLAEDPETLRTALAAEKQRAAELLANWQRAQADFTNYRRRTEEERGEFIKQANASLICAILPVLDDLERAFDAIPPELSDNEWVGGVRLIERKLRSSLEGQGLSTIKAVGEPFDPRFHEAVTQGKGEEGIVLAEVCKGYMLHDRVIRPSRVIVGAGQEEAKKESD